MTSILLSGIPIMGTQAQVYVEPCSRRLNGPRIDQQQGRRNTSNFTSKL